MFHISNYKAAQFCQDLTSRSTYYFFIVILIHELCTITQVNAETCPGYGHSCPSGQHCCGSTCCIHNYGSKGHVFRFSMWNMWYFWFIVIFILMSCFGSCGYWRRRQLMLGQGSSWASSAWGMTSTVFDSQLPRRRCRRTTTPVIEHYPTNCDAGYPVPMYSVDDSNNAVIPQGNFPCPPPYSEVINKPSVYPMYQNKEALPVYSGYEMTMPQMYNGYQAEASAIPSMHPSSLPPYHQAANQQHNILPNQLPANFLASRYQAQNNLPTESPLPSYITAVNQNESNTAIANQQPPDIVSSTNENAAGNRSYSTQTEEPLTVVLPPESEQRVDRSEDGKNCTA